MKYFLYLLLFTVSISSAQNGKTTISGTVSADGTPIPFTNITVLNTSKGTSADIDGNYTLKLSDGSKQLQVQALGFRTIIKEIDPGNYKNSPLNFELEEDQTSLAEVVITSGVGTATSIKRAPVSIVAISEKKINETTANNIIDNLAINTPGFTALKTGPSVSKPFLHGLGYYRILTLFDGIQLSGQQFGDEHGISIDDYNIERAEVIKGPSSILYGSGALAGVVSLIPYKPYDTGETLEGNLISEYQSNNGLFGNGLRLNYGGEKWSYLLRASYRIAKNYQNSVDDRVYNTGFRQKNFTAGVKYKSKKGYSTLNFNLYDILQGIPDGSRDSLTRKFTKQIFDGDMDNIKDRPIVSNHELNSYSLSPLHTRVQNYRVYSKSHYEFGDGDINLLWALQKNIRQEFNHPEFPDQAGTFLNLKTADYDVRYNAPEFSNIKISVGVNGMYQSNRSEKSSKSSGGATEFPIPNYDLFSIGGYIYGKWEYDRWSVVGGVRYDNSKQSSGDFYTREDPYTGFENQVSIPDTLGATLANKAFDFKFQGVSLSLGATYKINDHFSLKSNIARGYRAPSIDQLASNGLNPGAGIFNVGNRDAVPEFNLQEDLGVSMVFKDFSASLSFYNNYIKDYIYNAQLADENGNPIIDNQGIRKFGFFQSNAHLYGVDASLSIHPEAWKGFSFDNAFDVTYGSNKASEFEGKGVKGEYLPRIPALQLISSLTQKIDLKSNLLNSVSIKVSSDFNAAQDRYLALNGQETYTPGYILFNFHLNAEIKYSKKYKLNFIIGVDNVFDKAYQSALSRLKYFEYYAASPNGRSGIYDMGRNITAKLILPF